MLMSHRVAAKKGREWIGAEEYSPMRDVLLLTLHPQEETEVPEAAPSVSAPQRCPGRLTHSRGPLRDQ